MLEVISFTMYAVLMGVRHGMDSDHIAAIADMVGAEKQRKKQLQFGITYALGHGAIVMMIGLLAIFFGSRLPEPVLSLMEQFVGLSLLVLGLFILFSVFRQRQTYQHQSRIQIAVQLLSRFFKKENRGLSAQKMGIIGAFAIGIIHGIGAETPTQVLLISSSVGLDNVTIASMQLLFFTIGLLIATILITYLASWGFTAMKKRWAYILLGSITGGYSVLLGITMLKDSL